MATTTNVPSSNFEDLQRDVQDTTKFSNATGTYTNRAGKTIRPIPVVSDEIEAKAVSVASDAARATEQIETNKNAAILSISSDATSVSDAANQALTNDIPNAISSLGLQYPPISYTSGLTLDSYVKTYEQGGNIYLWGGTLGTVTSGAFDEGDWQPLQGDIQLRRDIAEFDTIEALSLNNYDYGSGKIAKITGNQACEYKSTSTTGLASSQLPKDLLSPQLVDGSGRLWELLPIPATKRKAYSALALGVVGDGLQDDTSALKAGLLSGEVHGNNITCKITSRIIVTNDQSGLVGSIDLVGSSSDFARTDGAYDNDDGTLLWISALDFEMSGGVHLRMDDSTPNDNTTCALVLRESSFSVERCKFSNFKRTKVVRVESCLENCSFNYNQIFDCEMGGSTTSQLTGLDVDDNRPNGSTLSLNVVGNVIKSLTVTPTFEASFGYQTDGINISDPESKGHIIRDNQISFVGEGIDCFGSDCQIVNNIIKDSYVSGVKLVNGATDCMVSNNHVIRPRTYGVVVAGSANVGTPTSGNRIENNHVVSVNANSDSPTTSFAFGAEDNTGASLPSDNTFKNNTARDCGNADRIIFNDATPKSNEFIDTKVIGSTPASIVSNGSGAVITFQDKAYIKAYPTGQDVAPSGEILNLSNVIENRYGELSSGVYTASVPRTLSVSGAVRTGSANTGKAWTLDLLKNGIAIERVQMVAATGGDLVLRLSCPSIPLNEGDELSFFVSHNESSSALITSSSLYSFTISEL